MLARLRAVGRMMSNEGRLRNMALGLLTELSILHCIGVIVGHSLLTRLGLSLSLGLSNELSLVLLSLQGL